MHPWQYSYIGWLSYFLKQGFKKNACMCYTVRSFTPSHTSPFTSLMQRWLFFYNFSRTARMNFNELLTKTHQFSFRYKVISCIGRQYQKDSHTAPGRFHRLSETQLEDCYHRILSCGDECLLSPTERGTLVQAAEFKGGDIKGKSKLAF